ncbi:MAG: hypothetical protein ACAI34_12650 [Verrucomicrobium sp.]
MFADSPPPLPGAPAPPAIARSASSLMTAEREQTPKSPLVFGIINLGFATLSVMSLVSSVAPLLFPATSGVEGGGVAKAGVDNGFRLMMAVSFVVVPLQLAAAIGLIKLREWARRTTLGLAAIQLAISLGVVAILTGLVPFPGAGPDVVATPAPSYESPTQRHLEIFSTAFGVMEVFIMTMLMTVMAVAAVYSFLQLYFLTRPRVRFAFRGVGQ